MVRSRWSLPAQRGVSALQVLLKPMITYGKGQTRWFKFNNQWVGRSMDGSWPGEGGLGHPQATYLNPKLFLLLACLKIPLRNNIPKYSFLGVADIFSVYYELQGMADPTYKGKLSLLFLSLGAHLDTKCLNYCPAQLRFLMESWVAHGNLVCRAW
jgi:hypothetical protein